MPTDPLEAAEWALDDAMAMYRYARTRSVKDAALTAVRIAYEALGDELDRLAEDEDAKAA